MNRQGSSITFPQFSSPDKRINARDMSECFSDKVAQVTDNAYDIVLLYNKFDTGDGTDGRTGLFV